jgi:hypothetical protein
MVSSIWCSHPLPSLSIVEHTARCACFTPMWAASASPSGPHAQQRQRWAPGTHRSQAMLHGSKGCVMSDCRQAALGAESSRKLQTTSSSIGSTVSALVPMHPAFTHVAPCPSIAPGQLDTVQDPLLSTL